MKNKKIIDALLTLKVNQELDKRILNTTVYKKKQFRKLPKLVLTISSILLLCIISISVVYAQEIQNFIKNTIEYIKQTVNHSYTPKEEWVNDGNFTVSEDSTGIHTISFDGKVEINEAPELNIWGYNSLSEIEEIFGIKFLGSENPLYKYISVFTSPEMGRIVIRTSNWQNLECIVDPENKYSEDKSRCTERTDKQINVRIMLLTQHAIETDIEENRINFADFPNQPSVEIYHSEILNTDIVIDGFPPVETSGTGHFALVFVYNNIMYLFDGLGYSNAEIIEIIESMTS